MELATIKKKIFISGLPYINDNDFCVTEIVPILKYICKKANRRDLLGKTLEDEVIKYFIIQVKIDEVIGKFIATRNKICEVFHFNINMDAMD